MLVTIVSIIVLIVVLKGLNILINFFTNDTVQGTIKNKIYNIKYIISNWDVVGFISTLLTLIVIYGLYLLISFFVGLGYKHYEEYQTKIRFEKVRAKEDRAEIERYKKFLKYSKKHPFIPAKIDPKFVKQYNSPKERMARERRQKIFEANMRKHESPFVSQQDRIRWKKEAEERIKRLHKIAEKELKEEEKKEQ